MWPESGLALGETTRLSDLRPLGQNCHRIVHSRRPWLPWSDLLVLIAGTEPERRLHR
jgi:predicted HNH restriction endonuclease